MSKVCRNESLNLFPKIKCQHYQFEIDTDCLHEECLWSHLQGFVWKLFVGPLLQFDVYSGVKGTRIHCLGSR